MFELFFAVVQKIADRILIFGISALFAVGCGEQSGEEYLNKGADYVSKGELNKAELELKNAIQQNPDAAEPYYQMALLNEKSLNFKAMRMNLKEAVKIKPSYIEAREKLAKVHFLFNDLDLAEKEVEEIRKMQPENTTAKIVFAQILDRSDKSGEAMTLVSEVLAEKPDFVDALSLKAVLLFKNGDLDGALDTVDRALGIEKDNVSFHLFKIKLHGLKGDNNAVIGDYQTLITLQPDNDELKYALAKAYVVNQQQEEADTVLRNLIKEKPGNLKAKLMLLEFLSISDKRQANAELNDFLNNSNPKERIELAKWILLKNDLAKAKSILEQIVAGRDDNNKEKQTALYMLAALDFQQQEYDRSSTLIERLLQINPDYVDAKVLKAGILLKDGEEVAAEELLNNILWEKPDSDNAMVLLANLYQKRGERDKAHNKFLEAFKTNPANKQALLPLVDRALKKNHYDYAKELIRTSIAKGGEDLNLLEMLVKINFAEKNWDEAGKVIKIMERKKAGQLKGNYLTAQMLTQQKKYNEANELYRKILEKAPWHTLSLAALASNLEKLGQRNKMLEFLEDFSKKHPKNSASRLLTSRFLVLENKTGEAIALLSGFLQQQAEAESVYVELARLQISQGNPKGALKTYQQGLSKKPDSIKLMMALATFYQQEKKADLAIELYEKILTINPSLDIAKNNLAAILLERESEQNTTRAVELTRQFKKSEQPYFLDTYAWAQFKKGDDVEALQALKKVVVLAPDVPVFRYHLAKVYHQQGKNTEASLELHEALEQGKKSPFVEAELAQDLLNSLTANK